MFFRFILIITTLISCTQEDSNKIILVPNVYTLDAVVANNGGVTLNGIFEFNENPIDSFGFEYALDSLFTNHKKIIQLDYLHETNEKFSFFLGTNLEENTKYFYRAYIISDNLAYFGEKKEFISNGSIAPQIKSISGEFGHISDTLEIYGKYFKDSNYETLVDFSSINSQVIFINDTIIKCKVPTNINNVINDVRLRIANRANTYSHFTLYKPIIETINPIVGVIGDTISINGTHFDFVNSRNKVFFGDIESTVIESNRESIKVVVPENIESPSESILLNAQLQDVTYNTLFQLSAPEINSISPLNATFRDELTINGNNFDFEISRNKVYFGSVEATITYADKNTIKVIVPDDLESSSEPIKVIAQLQEVVFDENFQLIPPEINFVLQNVYTNQDITIQGAYFHPILDNNFITIENIEVNLTSGDTKSLNTKIPLGPFPRRKAIVKIQLLDLIVEYNVDLNILDKWVMISNDLPFRFHRSYNAVVANGNAYLIAKPKGYDDDNFYLWKYDSTNLDWEKISIPFSIYFSGVIESNSENIYLYAALNYNNFWEFDTTTSKWTKKSSFIGKRRDRAAHFAIGENIYIGLGVDFQPYTPISYTDFYKFNPKDNNWVRVSDIVFDIWGGNQRSDATTFVINDIAYLSGGARGTGDVDCWSYNPNSNQWIEIMNFVNARNYTSSFSLNGFGYVTGGSKVGGGTFKDCWKYNPFSNTWEQIEDIGSFKRENHFSFSINGRAYVGGGEIGGFGSTQAYDIYEFIPDE